MTIEAIKNHPTYKAVIADSFGGVMTVDKQYKQYCTLSAIYRMLRQKRITPEGAKHLLHTRANYNEVMADRIVSIWKTAYEIRQAHNL